MLFVNPKASFEFVGAFSFFLCMLLSIFFVKSVLITFEIASKLSEPSLFLFFIRYVKSNKALGFFGNS